MIFGLPGAALAMYRCAKPEKKKAAGGLLLSGCGSRGPQYQQVVNEVNQKYGAHMKVDFNGTDITPEQLRAHLEAVAQSQRL